MDLIESISGGPEEAAGRRRALLRWRLTHRERECGPKIDGRCRCACPDHGCVDIYTESYGAVECVACRDTRLVRRSLPREHPDFGKAVPCPACHTPEQLEALTLARRIDGLRPHEWAECAIDGIEPAARREELRAWAAAQAPPFLTLYGANGTGKTWAALALCVEAAHQEMRVLFRTAIEFLDELRASFDRKDVGVLDVERPYKAADLLVIDDLGAQASTGWAEERLFSVIDGRGRAHRPTVLTLNTAARDLGDPRLTSRVFGDAAAKVLMFGGADRRMA